MIKHSLYSSLYMLELIVTDAQAKSVSHPGPCDDDVEYLCNLPEIREQTDAWDDEKLRCELREFGAWDEEELSDREANVRRLVWSLCCDYVEGCE